MWPPREGPQVDAVVKGFSVNVAGACNRTPPAHPPRRAEDHLLLGRGHVVRRTLVPRGGEDAGLGILSDLPGHCRRGTRNLDN